MCCFGRRLMFSTRGRGVDELNSGPDTRET